MIRIFRHYISVAYLCLLSIELCIFYFAMPLGSFIRFRVSDFERVDQGITFFASIVFLFVMILSSQGLGLYSKRTLAKGINSILHRTFASFVISYTLVFSIYSFTLPLHYAIGTLIYAMCFALFGIVLTRVLFYKFINLENYKTRILIIGSGKKAQEIISLNHTDHSMEYTIVGFLAVSGENSVVDQNLIINHDNEVIEIAKEHEIDEIVIAVDDNRQGLPLDELLDCRMSGMTILNILGFYEREQGLISLSNIYPSWLVFCSGFSQSYSRLLSKRLFDIFACLVLLFFTWPIMLLTAFMIWLESGFKGAIFYRQIRVGEKNQNFELLKFRSMIQNAEANGVQWAQLGDNRVSYVGRIIRKYRIDELPQILNVLKGDMSFVGPRPERPEFVHDFVESVPYYAERHRVKPGITGWAQLCYPYGAGLKDAIQKLQYDLYYVKNYSLFLDIYIMFNTVEVIVTGHGAR